MANETATSWGARTIAADHVEDRDGGGEQRPPGAQQAAGQLADDRLVQERADPHGRGRASRGGSHGRVWACRRAGLTGCRGASGPRLGPWPDRPIGGAPPRRGGSTARARCWYPSRRLPAPRARAAVPRAAVLRSPRDEAGTAPRRPRVPRAAGPRDAANSSSDAVGRHGRQRRRERPIHHLDTDRRQEIVDERLDRRGPEARPDKSDALDHNVAWVTRASSSGSVEGDRRGMMRVARPPRSSIATNSLVSTSPPLSDALPGAPPSIVLVFIDAQRFAAAQTVWRTCARASLGER